MASKVKRGRPRARSYRFDWWQKIGLIILLIGLVYSGWLTLSDSPKQIPTSVAVSGQGIPLKADAPISVNQEFDLAVQKVNTELAWVTSERSVVAGLPTVVRDRVISMVSLNQQKKFDMEINTNRSAGLGSRFMSSHYVDGAPRIIIYSKAVYEGLQLVDEDSFHSAFAAGIYHEFVHLEWSHYDMTPVQNLYEEIRAYSRTDWEAVRPMMANGFRFTKDFIQLDLILRGCGDDPYCPQFREAIRLHTHSPLPPGS